MKHTSFVSFREKSAWATLVALIVVYIPYFIYVYLLAARGQLTTATALGVFVAGVFFETVVAIVAHIVISIRGRMERRDERDIAIEAKAFRNAYFVVISAICLAVVFLTAVGLAHAVPALASGVAAVPAVAQQNLQTTAGHVLPKLSRVISAAIAMQLLLLCLVIGEITRYGTQVFCYRRGS